MDANKLPDTHLRDTSLQAAEAARAETHHMCPQSSHKPANGDALLLLICWPLTILADLAATITNLLKG